MRIKILHKEKMTEMTIDGSNLSLRQVRETVVEKTGIPVNELRIVRLGKELDVDQPLLEEDEAPIFFLDKREIEEKRSGPRRFWSNSNKRIDDVLTNIVNHLPSPLLGLTALSQLDKSLNTQIKRLLSERLKTPEDRKLMNEEFSLLSKHREENRTRLYPVSGHEKAVIQDFFEKKTGVSIEHISVKASADGVKTYHVLTKNFSMDAVLRKPADVKGLSYVSREIVSARFADSKRQEISFCFNKKELDERERKLLGDSVIGHPVMSKAKSAGPCFGIRQAIGKIVAGLVEGESADIPYIEFPENMQAAKMVLRFKDSRYAGKLKYVLEKEGYIFGQDNIQSNKFNAIDIFPCEYKVAGEEDAKFIATSSIELNGSGNIFKFIFHTCELSPIYIAGFLRKEPILNLSNPEILHGFRAAFNEFIQSKIKEFQAKQGNGHLFDGQNHFAIKKKLGFLKELQSKSTKVQGQEELEAIFKDTDISHLDGDTLKTYQRFKAIFSELYPTPLKQNWEPPGCTAQ